MLNQLLPKILSLKKKISPMILISFVLSLIITTSITLPNIKEFYKKREEITKLLNMEKEIKQAINNLKEFPKIPHNINNESETKMILVKIKKDFVLSGIAQGEDIAGKFIEFGWQINNPQVKNLIFYLESLKRNFPIYYFEYQMFPNLIVLKGRIYHE